MAIQTTRGTSTLQANCDEFDQLGAKGWVLVSVSDGVAYFRRPIVLNRVE